jgi:hypothetical protein
MRGRLHAGMGVVAKCWLVFMAARAVCHVVSGEKWRCVGSYLGSVPHSDLEVGSLVGVKTCLALSGLTVATLMGAAPFLKASSHIFSRSSMMLRLETQDL